jgi:SSS family solute:Na+ symporter
MASLFFFTLLITLAIIYFAVGIYASRSVQSNTDYFLAGRNLGFVPLVCTLVAAQIGGGMLIGTSKDAYALGFSGLAYTIGFSLGFLLLGLGLASRLQTLSVATTAELFETKYRSVFLKKVASLFSIVTLCGILLAQFAASRTVLVALGLDNQIVYLIFWTLIIAYTIIGGLRAVALTDLAQVSSIIAFFVGLFAYCMIFIEPATFFTWASLKASQTQFAPFDWKSVTSIILMPALFTLFEQDLAQKFFAARTKNIARIGALSASIVLLLFSLIPVYLGMKAKLMGLVVAPNAIPLIPVIKALTNDVVVTLAVCGLFAAIAQTSTSLLCAISSNIAQDFDFSRFGLAKTVRSSQKITLLVGCSMFIASYFISSNIIGILIDSYALSVCCLVIPLVVCYFTDKVPASAAFGAIGAGLFGFVFFRFVQTPLPLEVASLLLSAIGYVIPFWWSRRQSTQLNSSKF